MATLTPTLTLTSSDVSSDTLSLSVTDSLTVESPMINISTITATTRQHNTTAYTTKYKPNRTPENKHNNKQ